MPSPLAHTLFGLTLYHLRPRSFPEGPSRASLWMGWLIVASWAPDLDFLPGWLLGDYNRYHQIWSHTLVFSMLFALLAGGMAARISTCFTWFQWFVLLLALVLSHLLLDYFTEDTRPPIGFPLLWPFSDRLFSSSVSIFPPLLRDRTLPRFWAHNAFTLVVEGLLLLPLWILARKVDPSRTK